MTTQNSRKSTRTINALSWWTTTKTFHYLGRGGGQLVNVLAFYSVDPS